MIELYDRALPSAWCEEKLGVVTEINPKVDKKAYADSLKVAFVPMPSLEAETGHMDVNSIKEYREVKKGYTPFFSGDVLFAKITPCMENGKSAVVPELPSLIGFGSTEFHVFRCGSNILNKYIYYFISSKAFRHEAEHNMTGAVGQRRVPAPWLAEFKIPIPPLPEQHRIVAKIEQLFSELDKGIESLKTAREQLKVYRQALLKHAFEGKLTEQWRKDNADQLESAGELLARIQQEREARYQQQLDDWKKAVKAWEANGKEGKKPGKPSKAKEFPEITDDEKSLLPLIPKEWFYLRLSEIAQIGSGMSVSKSRKIFDPVEVSYLRVANVQRGKLILDSVKTMTIEKHQLEQLKLQKWDVLFNEGGDRDKLGRGWIWEDQIQPCITQNHVFRASTFVGGEIHAKFVSHWGNTFGRDYFDKGGKQTTNLASINKTVLSMFPVPVTSIDEQTEIISKLSEIGSEIDSMESEIEKSLVKAEALRQSILKQAFSGKLVPKDPNDEPAAELLNRITKEKEILKPKAASKKRTRKRSNEVVAL